MEEGGEVGKAIRLYAAMTEVFPDLAGVRLSHCWLGQMGFTLTVPLWFSEEAILNTMTELGIAGSYCAG